MGESDNLEDVGYLQDIISYIFDEKKIVTYKWISNVLAIHVNRAKQLLYTFIKHISEERLNELKVTYLVGGILPNARGCRFQVVSENDLEKVKAQFKVITSEHIYSVSLKNCLADLTDLCSVDGVKDSKVERHGAVRCTKSLARTTQELASKRQGAYTIVDDDKKWPTAQPKQQGKELSGENNDKKPSKTSNGIASMFAAQNGKKKVEESTTSKKTEEAPKGKSTSSPEKKVPATKNAPKDGKSTNRLAAMFSAQKPKTIKKDIQEENKSKNDKEESERKIKQKSEINSKLVEKHEEKETDSKNVQEKSSKTKKKSESRKSKQKKRKASDNEEKNKKRKRIVMMEDSDSSADDIFGSDEEVEEDESYSQTPIENEEEEIEESPQVVESKDPDPPEPQTNGHRGRKRRLVDKTYVDDEGYMVTKKVYEFVSGSESEGEKENEKASEKTTESNVKKTETHQNSKAAQGPQKPQKNSNQKKNSSPEKKKQATLMNFFKRS